MQSYSGRDYRIPLDPMPTPLGVESGDVIEALMSWPSFLGLEPVARVFTGDVLVILRIDGPTADVLTRDGLMRRLHLHNKSFRILCKKTQDSV